MEKSKIPSPLLADFEQPAAALINPLGKSPMVLICEHASNVIPQSLGELGLSKAGQISHAAWDLGAYELACKLSELLDAPLVASRISRLVYDCNRDPKSGLGIPTKSELIDVPGNQALSDSDRNERVSAVYEPFHELVDKVITERVSLTDGMTQSAPAIITIHSFTPIYFGEERVVELGLLHDKDDRLAGAMLKIAKHETCLNTQLNAPYDSSDNVMHTLNKHAQNRKLLNVMIEVKNDLLSTSDDINALAVSLNTVITKALASI